MIPRIEILQQKRLVGISVKMSLVNDRTRELWGRFMPELKHMPNRLSEDKISLQVYPNSYFEAYGPEREFEKWASVEVTDFSGIPVELQSFTLKEGLYAVFDYKGSSNDNSIFQYIYSSWLPNSDYVLDNRPHFEVLGKKYKNDDPSSEEEIWIPISLK